MATTQTDSLFKTISDFRARREAGHGPVFTFLRGAPIDDELPATPTGFSGDSGYRPDIGNHRLRSWPILRLR